MEKPYSSQNRLPHQEGYLLLGVLVLTLLLLLVLCGGGS